MDKNQKLAELIGEGGLWLIGKGSYYYRPNSSGYTDQIPEAGRYTKEQADSICRGSRELRMESEPAVKYDESLDAMQRVERKLADLGLIGAYNANLAKVTSRAYQQGLHWNASAINASAALRADAVFLTFEIAV